MVDTFTQPVLTDEEREHRRGQKRAAAAQERREAARLARLAVAGVGAVALLWQLTWLHPSPVGVVVAMLLCMVGVAEMVRSWQG